ncbi:hypothetical protein PRIPAC_86671 [Pristionchus pacificus]|uniref:Uncharacterized protein n=1 Tax=Pristionchus pacificus TaxID=54126 RepID=A0A2A6BN59_PRIPA|nr:hypothetical protein PRIPAC_86671 [Pristionchus pacificus]|eukprot:PDM67191.1 hypothetical protein PRIPAC_48608 [Pristionchus pacificus]
MRLCFSDRRFGRCNSCSWAPRRWTPDDHQRRTCNRPSSVEDSLSQKDLMRLSSKVYEIPRAERAQPGYCRGYGRQTTVLTFSIASREEMCGEIPPCIARIFSPTYAQSGIQLKTDTKIRYLHSSIDVVSEEQIAVVCRISTSRQDNSKFAELSVHITHNLTTTSLSMMITTMMITTHHTITTTTITIIIRTTVGAIVN